ncbi:MAG TPA: TSUP family transporter [Polyangia bacterium]
MILAALLSVIIGLSLGLLGGGGSIVTVPILVYAIGLPAKTAIATSLFVVALTSLAAVVPHARAGHVRWKTAWLFGGTGMVGAFLGGRLAKFLPPNLLLVGFALMMLATAIAMIRGRREGRTPSPAQGRRSTGRIAIEGTTVGLVTGLVGAGGGFLVVPALVLLGGLTMTEAVGTSLVVIALKSSAGFLGHLGHVDVPWTLAAVVSAAAISGSVVGSKLSGRVPEAWLRPLFGWFVAVMSAFVIGKQIPGDWRGFVVYQRVFVERWPWWATGVAIGLIVLGLLWYDNKLLGVSTGCGELCHIRRDPQVRRSWRLLFLAGIFLGGLLATFFSGAAATFGHGQFDTLVTSQWPLKALVLLGAGILIGVGARLAGGCTSGHGIVGVAQGAKSSLLATAAFLVGGFVTMNLLHLLRG